jgi:predicted anti-sigma-YlaC factor YlaD
MECSEIEKKLSALIDGEIIEPERVFIEEHLKSCVHCQKEFENLSQVSDCLNSLTEVEVSPYFLPRLKRRIKEEETRQVVRLPFFGWSKRVALPVGIVALFVIAIFGGNFLGQRLNQRVAKVAEQNEELATVTGITSFEDFSEGSLVDTYAGLLTEGGK